jgi:hypothetical protein
MKSGLFTLIFWLLTSFHIANASTLSVHTEPDFVSPGEMFNLIFELDENAPAGLPDFGPLAYDFYIHGTAHSASYVYGNGQSKATTRWSLTLRAKHTGKLTIPAIQIGKARSRAFTLNQNAASNQQNTTSRQNTTNHIDQALFIKTVLSNKHPRLNQQVIYTVKIFHYSSILDAAYQPPNLGDALIVPLGSNQQYQVIEKGRPYLVEEQKYAFFPQKLGSHIIFPPKFQALIYDDVPRRAEAHGASETLQIKPIPDDFTPSTWLPAKAVSIHEDYSQSNTKLREGSTLTRIITLQATGLPAELLPPIEPKKNSTFKMYPEKPDTNNRVIGDNVVGQMTIKINYLLNQPGTVTIPEQKITWFNTETNQPSNATLPAKTLQIIADANTQVSPASPIALPLSPIQKPVLDKKNTAFMHGVVLHMALFATFLLLSVIFFFSNKTRARPPNPLKPLKKACLGNNPVAAREALLAWAQHIWPDKKILNLDDIIQQAPNDKLIHALQSLSESLYQTKKTSLWQGHILWLAIQSIPKKSYTPSSKKSKNVHLPPLNPH